MTVAHLAVEKQTEAFRERKRRGVARGLQLGKAFGHAEERQRVKFIECRMGKHEFLSMVVARSPDVGVEDRRAVRGPLQDARVEIVVEDGLDRAIGAGFDLKRPEARRLHALAAEGLCESPPCRTL